MIPEFVERWEERKEQVRASFNERPDGYLGLVKKVIGALWDEEYGCPDVTRIHEIDDGHYQGTIVYVIGAYGYQPSEYWYVKVGYGSCSACDTLQYIDYGMGNYKDELTEAQIDEYMKLALHILQGLKKMGEDIV